MGIIDAALLREDGGTHYAAGGPLDLPCAARFDVPWDLNAVPPPIGRCQAEDPRAAATPVSSRDAAPAAVAGLERGLPGAEAQQAASAAKYTSPGGHFRKLAASLHQAQHDRGIAVVMVTSAVPGEGKSRTVAELAKTLSGSYGRRVLLIDADLRQPVLHKVLGVPNRHGLTDLLCGDVRVETAVAAERLDVLPAGRPDPDPLAGLTSGRMREVLARAKQAYDWVLVDTPPVVLLPDAELLGSMVDTVLLVVSAGETDYRLVTRAVDALGRDRIIGVVLNNIEEAAFASSYAGYHYAGRTSRR
jgi:capsular exopolysaccharide synthesis family protein